VKLVAGTDFTATNGTSITLASGATINDVIDIVAYGTFVLADHYDSTASDARYVNVTGDTMTGDLSFGDNNKAIFGAGSDLQIYHIADTGNLIQGQSTYGNIDIMSHSTRILDNGSNVMADFSTSGSSSRLFNGADGLKLATTATGIDVTGTVAAAAGTALLPSITTTGDLNTGMWFPAADTIAFSEGGVEALRINSSGNVGIGTSSPAANSLTLENKYLSFSNSQTKLGDNGIVTGAAADGNTRLEYYNGKYFTIAQSGTERMRIDSSGNVGIGTSSPASDTANERILQVNAPTTFATLSLSTSRANVSGDNIGKISFDVLNNTATYRSRAQITTESAGSTANKYGANMIFSTASDNTTEALERMRIDSSGNLLVGKTAANTAVDGIELNSGDVLVATRNNDAPLILNRRTSDGEIIVFRKDNTTVGSIGIQSGGFTIDGETNHTGLMFAAASVLPRDNSAGTNGTVDLGTTDGRWKDLYLSGGVYLGGTVAANHLDDYEEGIWTVALASSGTQPTYNFTSTSGGGASYIKVGRMVTIFFDRYVNITVAGTGNVRITGLPFSSDLVCELGGYSAVQFRASSAFGTSSYVTGYVDVNEILVELGNGTTSSPANWTTGTNIRFSGTVTYRTA
jgi:hypothetical protein